jgi:hypothetical protein
MTLTAFMYYWLEENKRQHKAQLAALAQTLAKMKEQQQQQQQQQQPTEEELQQETRQYPQLEDSDNSEDCDHCNYEGPADGGSDETQQTRVILVVAFYFVILLLFNVYLAGVSAR